MVQRGEFFDKSDALVWCPFSGGVKRSAFMAVLSHARKELAGRQAVASEAGKVDQRVDCAVGFGHDGGQCWGSRMNRHTKVGQHGHHTVGRPEQYKQHQCCHENLEENKSLSVNNKYEWEND